MTDNNEIWIEELGYIPKELLLDRLGVEKIILNDDYNFDTFVAGESNKAALSAAKYAAEFPGGSNNPLMIYGMPGLGKTHLLNAVALYIEEHDPNLEVLFISGDDLSIKLYDEIRYGTVISFLRKLELCDVLIVDDIQYFMGGRDALQETFFEIIEDLYKMHKQIIISATDAAVELMRLDIRLKMRLPTCVIAEIDLPEFEIKKAGLLDFANMHGLEMTREMNEIIDYIANMPDECVVGVKTALSKLLRYTRLDGVPVTLDYARFLFEPRSFDDWDIYDNVDTVDTVEAIREDERPFNPWR